MHQCVLYNIEWCKCGNVSRSPLVRVMDVLVKPKRNKKKEEGQEHDEKNKKKKTKKDE